MNGTGIHSPAKVVKEMQLSHLFFESDRHPILITPDNSSHSTNLSDIITVSDQDSRKLLLQHGAILYRDFRIRDTTEFQSCTIKLGAEPFGYIGGNSPRNSVSKDVYTSTEHPAEEIISLHHEQSYLRSWPRRLFFYCLFPPGSGGQTSLAVTRDVMREIPQEILTKFRSKKLNYIKRFHSSMPIGKSWQDTYMTPDRTEVESIITSQGCLFTWSSKGDLRVDMPCDAFVRHPVTSEELWFNQAEQWHPSSLKPSVRSVLEDIVGKGQLPHDCEYGDGEPIEDGVVSEIRRALNKCKLLFTWKAGDLLMLDNVLVMHGRESFVGSRKILAYLSST